MTTIPGLLYEPQIMSADEEVRTLEYVARIPDVQWEHAVMRGVVSKRSFACFGFRYITTGRRLESAPPLPEWLLSVRARCAGRANVAAESLNQAIVTRYPKDAGIGVHSDAPVFGDVVISVSLGAPCRMVFRRDGMRLSFDLSPRSLLVLRGEARQKWTHEITPESVKSTRYSITLRQVAAHIGS